jgi:hypothetical protein
MEICRAQHVCITIYKGLVRENPVPSVVDAGATSPWPLY